MNLRQTSLIFSALIFFLSALLLPGSLTSVAAKESGPQREEACLSKGWPHEQSDLQPDPALTFGTLDNGLRYVIMINHEPKGRVALHLDVQTGSLHETDEQRGIAHYLEHMMFNGTSHYPPDKLIEYFQSIGMAFGPDTNAHTSYDETVYNLLLPSGEEKTLDEGLQVLADYAGGALLLPKEVDKERGVILAEKRERNSAMRRVFVKDIEQAFAGTLLARRDVIGTDEVLNKADAALLRQYYERWYRPDNMIVVAVGDTDSKLLAGLIKKQFSQLKAKSKAQPDCLPFGNVAENGTEAFYQSEQDLGSTEVSIGSVWNTEPESFTKAVALRQLREILAAKMMNNRLESLVNRKDSPLTKAYFYSEIKFGKAGYASLQAKTAADKWQESLDLLNTGLRQVMRDGFTAEELDRAKKELMTQLNTQVQAAGSRTSTELADSIIDSLNDAEVPLSPQQELDLYGPAVEKTALTEINETFRSLWHERRLVKVAGTADLTGKEQKPEEIVLAAQQAAEAAELKPWQPPAQGTFPYLPEPETAATVTKHIAYDKIKADRYVFSNGLILNLKKTDFEPNELRAAVVFGKGELTEPKPGLSLLAPMLVEESGVGGLEKEQLKAALAAYSSSVYFDVDEDSFQFQGKGLKEETELLFQLLSTRLHDPAFRADALKRTRQKIEQLYAQMGAAVEGVMQLKGARFLAGGNSRYGLPPLKELQKLTLADVENWLAPLFRNEPLEISVVGDFDPEQVIKLAGKYFGEPRTGGQQAEGEKILFPSSQKLTLKVTTASDKAMLAVAWPTDDFWDISRTRRLSVLAAVLDDRLRKQIREDMGAAYSPYVYNQSSTVDPGYGVLRSMMLVEPDKAALLTAKLKQVGAQLAKGTITAEELERALEPTLTSIKDMVRTNRYWLESVLINSARQPQRLDWPTTIQSDFAAIKTKEIATLAKRYLQPEKAAEIIILPKKN
ncbi:Zinc protease [Candidatus Electronema halotolerans]